MPSGVYPRTEWHRQVNSKAMTGLKQSQITIEKRRQALKGRVRPQSELQHASEGLKRYHANNPDKLVGENNPFYGKKHTLETRQKIGQLERGIPMPSTTGANHWNWKGGIARLPYPYEFNGELKDSIRERDKLTCQSCGMTQGTHLSTYRVKLEIHHINENKRDNEFENLIALCKKCHSSIIQPCKNIAEFIYRHSLQSHILHISVDGVLLDKEV